jgi:tetratricopeptide (TPR) repeat protein
MTTQKKAKAKGKKKVVPSSKKQRRSLAFGEMWPWMALAAGASFLFLWPVIQSEYTELDDKHLILTNVARYMEKPWVVWTTSIFTPHYKPLVLLSWVIEGSVFGLKPEVLHFNNLLLHAVNSVLSFLIVFRLAGRFESTKKNAKLIAGFAALLFAVHPLHVESIAWAVERKDVMYTMFFFLGLLAYFRYLDRQSMKWMFWASIAFAASLLCKAPAIVFPVILLLMDWAYQRPLKGARLVEKWPVMIVFMAGLILYGVFGGGVEKGKKKSLAADEANIAGMISEKPVSDVYPLTELPSIYSKVVLIGLKGVFWYAHSYIPVGLSLAYPYRDWLPAIGHVIHIFPILLLLGAYFLWRKRKEYPFLFFTHALFFIALVPALIRTGLGKGIFLSDRYVYLAILGLLFFISGALVLLMDRKGWPLKRQYIVIGGIPLILGVLSFVQARVWHTGETLWSNVINKYPNIDYAYVNRAIWYKDNNMLQKALDDLNIAVKLDQFDDHALIHRGTLLRQHGNKEQALADFEEVLRRTPGNEHAINGKANVLFELGRYAEAEATYTAGLEIKKGMITLMVNRAAARYYLGKYAEALEDLEKAERRRPNYPGIYSKRTVIYMAMKDYNRAVQSAKKTAELEPTNHANYGDMGTALQAMGRHQEAIEAFTQAIRIYDKGERYYRGRAQSYEKVGNIAAAQQDRSIADSL